MKTYVHCIIITQKIVIIIQQQSIKQQNNINQINVSECKHELSNEIQQKSRYKNCLRDYMSCTWFKYVRGSKAAWCRWSLNIKHSTLVIVDRLNS